MCQRRGRPALAQGSQIAVGARAIVSNRYDEFRGAVDCAGRRFYGISVQLRAGGGIVDETNPGVSHGDRRVENYLGVSTCPPDDELRSHEFASGRLPTNLGLV